MQPGRLSLGGCEILHGQCAHDFAAHARLLERLAQRALLGRLVALPSALFVNFERKCANVGKEFYFSIDEDDDWHGQ
jgi:hypothetical protein